ncbi:MAG: hypothetical protein WC908_03680 [Candidatus Paceibacterota bacterium]
MKKFKFPLWGISQRGTKNKGYAILFTIVIVSAVSVITAGLTNAVYKQLILSSLAKDSQSAFYQADTASDCALYADRVEGAKIPINIITTGGSWTCGVSSLTVTPISGGYKIYPIDESSSDPCFRIDVTKNTITIPGTTKTTIKAKGYNICNTSNLRTVEREIQIDYDEQI